MKNITEEQWNNYTEHELNSAKSTLDDLGFVLDEEQIHLQGERHLMSGFKLVLTGRSKKADEKVIIKISSKFDGKKEIEHEHKARTILGKIDFAYHAFYFPELVLYTDYDNFLISITRYVKEPLSFLKHSNIEQFFMVIRAFEAQTGVQITTYSHRQKIKRVFGIIKAEEYIQESDRLVDNIIKNNNVNFDILNKAKLFIAENKTTLETYGDFLTHSDFVPHNLRVVDARLYLLDHTSIHFGNKYEGWARFMNYMIIYNPTLELYLKKYIENNRNKDEYLALRLMRVYKLLFLMNYYCNSIDKAKGNLNILTRKRIVFWQTVLNSILKNQDFDQSVTKEYKKNRDSLRSNEEIIRQKKLNQL
jgi:hypothetical protein